MIYLHTIEWLIFGIKIKNIFYFFVKKFEKIKKMTIFTKDFRDI